MDFPESVVLSKSGVITTSSLHDGYLLGIVYLENKRTLLLLRNLDRNIYGLVLIGVTGLRGDDLRNGCIIFDITVETGADVDPADIAYVHDLLDPFRADKFLSKAVEDFIARNLLLVRLNPSYGCSLVCICHGIELSQKWEEEIASLRVSR